MRPPKNAEKEIIRDIKEKLAFVASESVDEEMRNGEGNPELEKMHEHPDRKIIFFSFPTAGQNYLTFEFVLCCCFGNNLTFFDMVTNCAICILNTF